MERTIAHLFSLCAGHLRLDKSGTIIRTVFHPRMESATGNWAPRYVPRTGASVLRPLTFPLLRLEKSDTIIPGLQVIQGLESASGAFPKVAGILLALGLSHGAAQRQRVLPL